ncbi:MAG: YecR-like lipofamily protein [Deltaproteobacteria bacterium]|jgi:hypothetical protein|nr:YecR-like lipofamily protein [Deltaproteobacteria bacterium]
MRKMMLILSIAIPCILLAGCTVPPVPVQRIDWGAIGGSRADATIKLAYEYDPNRPATIPSEIQAIDIAKNRCMRWGYTGVEAFGSSINTCIQQNMYGQCLRLLVSREYQCIGDDNTQ